MKGKYAMASAAATMVFAPVAAQAQESGGIERASAPVVDASELEGQSDMWVVLAVAGVIAAVLLLASGSNDDALSR